MEDEAQTNNGALRPISQPNLASRFPSLRRLNSSEPYRHRSLPAEPSSGSDGGSETTFAVLYDDGPDYHVGHFDETGTVASGNRPDSQTSFAPSFRTRDSRIFGDEHDIERNPDMLANQRLLAEGYLSSNAPYMERSSPQYPMYSQETLTQDTSYHNGYPNEKASIATPTRDRPNSTHSHESWCTCDDNQGAPNGANYDIEAQKEPSTPTPFLSQNEKKGPSASEQSQGPRRPEGASQGGLSMLPPFPPGFPDELKVIWDGPDDPLNPKNWPSHKKWATTACIAAFTFLSPLASTMIAPALDQIERDLKITSQFEGQITLSIFVLSYAIGPMVLGPLSELYGRAIVSQVSNIVFLIFNTACGFAQNKQEMIAFRFLSGLGGSAPLALGGGVLGDVFKPEERGKAMGLYALGPLLGPAVGPIVGGFVAQYSTWRWLFYASSIVNVVILIFGFIFFKESYAPYILHRKAKKLRKQTGNPELRAPGEDFLYTPAWKKISKTVLRAFGMLFNQPIVQVMALYMAFSYGVLYLVLSTYPMLWMNVYHESPGIAGLNYISLGIGFFIGAPICGKASDSVYKKLKAKHKQGEPEFRMPLVIATSLLTPIGLCIYGWSAQAHTNWIVPNIGAFIFGIGTIAAFQCVTTYLVDTYMQFAASAVAAVTVLRSLFGFFFPIFAPAMFKSLGYGWGNTVLALAALGIGLPTPILLWIWGKSLRKRSNLASAARRPPPRMTRPPGADKKGRNPPNGAPKGPPTQ